MSLVISALNYIRNIFLHFADKSQEPPELN